MQVTDIMEELEETWRQLEREEDMFCMDMLVSLRGTSSSLPLGLLAFIKVHKSSFFFKTIQWRPCLI